MRNKAACVSVKTVMICHLVWAFFAVMVPVADAEESKTDQGIGFHLAKVGSNLNLRCFHGNESSRLYWYKHKLGQTPRLISSFYRYEKNGHLHNEFRNDPRFSSRNDEFKSDLTIRDLRVSDTATYYCGTSFSFVLEFTQGTFVSVQEPELDSKTSIKQTPPETVPQKDSVILNCTVHTGTCEEEQSIYWFRHTETGQIGLVQMPENQCERSPDSQTHTCSYNVPKDSMNQSLTGTYYCAVVSCGLILFGNGIRLNLTRFVQNDFLMYYWGAASALATILSAGLAVTACVMNRRKPCSCQEYLTNKPSTKWNESKDIHYSAVKEIKVKESKSKRDETWSQCVYLNTNLRKEG